MADHGPEAIDVEAVRADTPGVGRVVHLENAGSALPPAAVVDVQVEYLREEASNGGYETAFRHRAEFEAVYDSIAALIGAGRDEIAITSNATESFALAHGSIALGSGDRVLTDEAAYSSHFIDYLHRARRTGAAPEVVPSTPRGEIDVDALESMIDDRVRLIALTHIPTNGGLVNPAVEVGEVARRHQIAYILDACQSVGQLALDVEEIGCDFLSATGRKYIRGPRGTGFLYARRSILERTEPPTLDNHGATWVTPDSYEMRADARRYENWEFNVAAVLGLGAAVDYASAIGVEAIEMRVRALGSALRSRLTGIDGVSVRDLGSDPCAITTFTHDRVPASEIQAGLRERGINTSYTTPASTRIDATNRSLPDMVRASPHYYNTEAELDRLVDAVTTIVS